MVGTTTVTAQGLSSGRHDEEWGLSTGHQRGPPLATSGDFHMATDTAWIAWTGGRWPLRSATLAADGPGNRPAHEEDPHNKPDDGFGGW